MIVLSTKFTQGAWIVVVAAPVLFVAMKAVSPHYASVSAQLEPPAAGVALPTRIHCVVLVSNLLSPTLRALAFAQATNPATLRAVKVAAEEADDPLPEQWRQRGVPVRSSSSSRRTGKPCAPCSDTCGSCEGSTLGT